MSGCDDSRHYEDAADASLVQQHEENKNYSNNREDSIQTNLATVGQERTQYFKMHTPIAQHCLFASITSADPEAGSLNQSG
jgi:hypothetical protein